MTATAKIAISLPASLAERARRAVKRGRAASVSAYVTAALQEKAKGVSDDNWCDETAGPSPTPRR